MIRVSRHHCPFQRSLLAMALSVAGPASFVLADEPTFTVGIDTICPYGLAGCWPEVREPITKVPGVTTVSEAIDLHTLTCKVEMQKGLMLDLKVLRDGLRKRVGNSFTVRGVEATLHGYLVRDGSDLALQLCGDTNIFRLAPLRQKVQTDDTKLAQWPSEDEFCAYGRLIFEYNGQSCSLRITGPLVDQGDGRTILEVRQFQWTQDAKIDVRK
jgi:hypothetical protein